MNQESISHITAQWLGDLQTQAQVSDEGLANALGYQSPQVIGMIKAGRMKVPLAKAPLLAKALGVDPAALMRRLLQDSDPELLQAIEQCLGMLCLSNGEKKLIEAIRKANRGTEPVPIMFDRDAIITLVVA